MDLANNAMGKTANDDKARPTGVGAANAHIFIVGAVGGEGVGAGAEARGVPGAGEGGNRAATALPITTHKHTYTHTHTVREWKKGKALI